MLYRNVICIYLYGSAIYYDRGTKIILVIIYIQIEKGVVEKLRGMHDTCILYTVKIWDRHDFKRGYFFFDTLDNVS